MKADRLLVAVNGLIAAALGFWLAARGEPLPAAAGGFNQEMATLRLAGIGLAGLGLAFGILGDPGSVRERRRVALLLAGGDLALAALAVRQWVLLGTDWRALLNAGVFTALAGAFAWLATHPQRARLAKGLSVAHAIIVGLLGTSAYILLPSAP